MSRDLTEELPLVPLKDLPRLPVIGPRRRGRPLNVRTAFRWATKGVRGVVLETVVQGGVRFTSLPALRRFFAALGEARSRRPPVSDSRQQNTLKKATAAEVDEELRRLGI